jgi:hypothetical protein
MLYLPYQLTRISWPDAVNHVAEAEDAVARLDERIAHSAIRDGWISRSHFLEAQAVLGLEGELVLLEDLVLHDAKMDVRTPSHELTTGHTILRARRRLAAKDDIDLSKTLITELAGRGGSLIADVEIDDNSSLYEDDDDEDLEPPLDDYAEDDDFVRALRKSDALAAKAESALSRLSDPDRYLIHDEDWDENGRIAEWLTVVDATRDWPATLAAVVLEDAWNVLEPLQHERWVGRLLVAAVLASRGKTRSHLALVGCGLRTIPLKDRRHRAAMDRYIAGLRALSAGAHEGLRHHDAWATAKQLLDRKLRGKRSNSRLPEMIDLLVGRPLVSTRIIASELRITRRAAQNLVEELGCREITGRGRFRAWSLM